MTRTTNARVAGFTFLFYIALGIAAMVVSGRTGNAAGIAAQLAGIAQHASAVRLAAVLNLITGFAALVLAVTLYAVTRDEDPDLAMLALTCRVAEGVIGGIAIQRSLGLLWLATAAGANGAGTEASRVLGEFLMGQRWSFVIGAMFFAVGSTLFCWLLLRGRMIPIALTWLGVLASVLPVVLLPLQIMDVLPDPMIQFMWLPMAAFEIPLGLWLIIKGVAVPARALKR